GADEGGRLACAAVKKSEEKAVATEDFFGLPQTGKIPLCYLKPKRAFCVKKNSPLRLFFSKMLCRRVPKGVSLWVVKQGGCEQPHPFRVAKNPRTIVRGFLLITYSLFTLH
ncbi:MAG: hypothetical protein IJ365_03220, partial [Clostridia bacterium]|nr:hypothetical protein [Clostridia bacterium]